MSDNMYNLEGVKTELRKRLEARQALLTAWKAVTFPTKKDGTPFKILAKNISGATLKNWEYAMQPGENHLRVNAWTKLNGYISEEIDCYCLVKYMKDPAKLEKKENYLPKIRMLEQVYCYDLEDIKEAVADKIERGKKYCKALKAQLENADSVYNNFVSAYSEAMKTLRKESDMDHACDLFYLVRDTVRERYPYC